MAIIPPRGRNEPAEAWIDRVLPQLLQALSTGRQDYAVDGGGNVYATVPVPAGSVPKLGTAPKIVKIDTENLIDGAVTLEATDIPDMVLAHKIIAGDVIALSLLAGDIEAVTATIDNLRVNDANIANVNAGKITAGEIAVELDLYAANIFGGFVNIAGADRQLLALQSAVSDYVVAIDQRDDNGGGISIITPAGYGTSGNLIDVAMRGSGNGVAVRAYDTAKGVLAVADGDNAIQGEVSAGSFAGVRGIGGQYGVQGSANGTGYGVYGTNTGTGSGVRGENTGTGTGVHGSAGNGGVAVRGVNSSAGNGVVGTSSSGDGVSGASSSGTGVRGSGSIGGEFSSASNVAAQGTTSTGIAFNGIASSSSYASVMVDLTCTRAGSGSYRFLDCWSANGGDVEARIYGDGTITYDGSLGTPADYAEYFESTSGEVIPAGTSVVLDDGKIHPAAVGEEEDIIGVVRPRGASIVVGNSAWNRWNDKFLRDDYDAPILDEDGNRALNPDYDPSQPYVPRSERPEWCIVGLVGQVAVTRGQPVNPRWRKMGDVGPTVERWFIR